MSRFLEVTMVDEGDEWPLSVCLDAIQVLEAETTYDSKTKEFGVRSDLTQVVFEGGVKHRIRIGYDELKGILEGEGREVSQAELRIAELHYVRATALDEVIEYVQAKENAYSGAYRDEVLNEILVYLRRLRGEVPV